MPKSKKKRLIVVLGMHRSGTSVITRGLQPLGVSLGSNLMPPIDGNNAKGFFEDLDINSLNIDALNVIGSDWSYLSPLSEPQLKLLHEQGFILRAVSLLREKIKDVDTFAFKDPRVAKLLPFWKQVFVHLDLDVCFLLAMRHPLSVVKSLAQRDGFAHARSYLLWLGHVLESLRATADKPTVLIDYDSLMQSPDIQLQRIAQTCQLKINVAELEEFKNEFLDHELRHTKFELNDLFLDPTCPQLVQDVFNCLVNVAQGRQSLDSPSFKADLNNWVVEFDCLKTSLKLIDEHLRQIASLNQAVHERDSQIAGLNQASHEKDVQIASLNQAVYEKDGQIVRLNKSVEERDIWIDKFLSSRSWRITRPLRVLSALRIQVPIVCKIIISSSFNLMKQVLPIRLKKLIKSLLFNEGNDAKEIVNVENCGFEYSPKHLVRAKKLKILIMDMQTPEPDKDSGSVDAYNLMKILIELGHAVSFCPVNKFEYAGVYTDALVGMGVKVIDNFKFKTPEIHLREKGFDYDLVIMSRVHVANKYLEIIRNYCKYAYVVFNTVDLHFLRELRQADLSGSKIDKINAEYTKKIELKCIANSDAAIIISKDEMDLIKKELPDVKLFNLPLVMDLENNIGASFKNRKDIFFIGGFQHLPNVDAVKYFIDKIWPSLSKKNPEMKFHIVGSNMPKEIKSLNSIRNVVATGYVEDISTYFNNCKISIAPLRFGAGLKGKVGRSLGYGCPVVGSPVALEGVSLNDYEFVMKANTPEEYINNIEKIYFDEHLWNKVSDAGKKYFEVNYSMRASREKIQAMLYSFSE